MQKAVNVWEQEVYGKSLYFLFNFTVNLILLPNSPFKTNNNKKKQLTPGIKIALCLAKCYIHRRVIRA